MSSQVGDKILIADDDRATRLLLEHTMKRAGYVPSVASNGREALELLAEDIDVAVLDLRMPEVDGMECLREIQVRQPDTQVIILTANTDTQEAVRAMKNGAFDYVTKPFDQEELMSLVAKAFQTARLTQENRQLRHTLHGPDHPPPFIGDSDWAQKLRMSIERFARLDSSVLITGESGVGKGLLARMIHAASPRASQPCVTVNCTAMPRDLVESELFGHEKGAFTGAHERRLGRIEMAEGGTLFLDEIGDMPLELQPKLLNFLQERTYQRIGSNKMMQADVRVIAATNQDLRAMVQAKTFREDLYFRLNVLPVELPPLRERKEDIPFLAEYFLQRIASRRGSTVFTLSPQARELIIGYAWPGNVRELENVLERVTAFAAGSTLGKDDFPAEVFSSSLASPDPSDHNGGSNVALSLAGLPLHEVEKMAIEQTLAACEGNKARAARQLEISEKSIYNKIKRLGVST